MFNQNNPMRLLFAAFILLNLIQLQSAQTTNVTLNYHEGQTATISIQNLTNQPDCYFGMGDFDKPVPEYLNRKMLKTQNIQPLTDLTTYSDLVEDEYAMICFNETYPRICNFYQVSSNYGFAYHDVLSGDLSLEQVLPMKNDSMQYYPVKMRKLQEYTAFITKSKIKNDTSGLFLLTNSQRGAFINLLFPIDFSNKSTYLSVPTNNDKNKILLINDYGKENITACLFDTTTNSTKSYTPNDLVNISVSKALGLAQEDIRAMEVDVSRPNVVYVFAKGAFYAFQITDLNQPWILLGSLRNLSSYNSDSVCRMRKAMNYLIIYCQYEGKLARINISDEKNPLLMDDITINNSSGSSNFDFGTDRFFYFLSAPSYGCLLSVYNVLSKNIALRYQNSWPVADSGYCKFPPLTSFALDDSAEVLGVYNNGLNFHKIPKEQTLAANLTTSQITSFRECTNTLSSFFYECAYALPLRSYCDVIPQNLTLNLKLRIMTPIYPVTLSTYDKTNVAGFRPSDLFTGPIFNMKASLKPGYSNYNLAMSGLLDKTIFSPGSFRFPVISMIQYQNKIYILSGTRNPSLYFTYANLDNPATSSDRLQDHSITYELNLSSLSNVTVESCTISPLEVKASNVSFLLSCPVIGSQNTSIAFVYYFMNYGGKVKSILQTERFSSVLPPKNHLGENLLVTVSDPQPDGGGNFIKSVFFDPSQSGVLRNKIQLEVNYSSVLSEDEVRARINTTGILSYDLWSYKYSGTTSSYKLSYVVVALTLDQQLILSFIGESSSVSRFWKLENTSFFQKDKFTGEKPNFVKVRWSESSCGSTPRLSFILMAANFYTYLIEANYAASTANITVLNTFAYYPGYLPLDARYDPCTNMVLTYSKKVKDDGDMTTQAQRNSVNYNSSDGCAVLVYFTNNSNVANIIDTSTINDNISCPVTKILEAPLLVGKSYNEGLSLVFLSNTTLHTRYARHYCLVNVTSPKNINESVDVIVNGSNSFYSAEFRGYFDVTRDNPITPASSSSSGWLIAVVAILIIAGLIAFGIAQARKRRNQQQQVVYQAAFNEADNYYENFRESKADDAEKAAYHNHKPHQGAKHNIL